MTVRTAVFAASAALLLISLPAGIATGAGPPAPVLFAGVNGTWVRISDGYPPSARNGAASVWDSARSRMLVIGGNDGSYLSDVAALSAGAVPRWSGVPTTGEPLPGRYRHSAVYDSARDRIIVFGGYDGAARSDVWALPLGGTSEWQEITPAGAGPAARSEHSAIYDPVGDRMIVFGGWDGSSLRNDVWALALSGDPEWVQLAPAGTPPNTRRSCGAAYDPLRNRMLVFGGGSSAGYKNDVWALSLGSQPSWTRLLPLGTAPAIRQGASASYDSAHDALVVFGGYNGTHLGDAWSVTVGSSPAWTELSPGGDAPEARTAHVAEYDAAHDRVLFFGGAEAGNWNVSETWILDVGAAPAWSPLSIAAPCERREHSAVYVPSERRMFVFGGSSPSDYFNDLWAFSLDGAPVWERVEPTYYPAPSPRHWHSAVYDTDVEMMRVYGGVIDEEDYAFDDQWLFVQVEMDYGTENLWYQFEHQAPGDRCGQAAAWDSSRQRMMIFGGARYSYGGGGLNDVWTADNVHGWTHITPSGTPPPEGAGAAAIYDPIRDRMLVFGTSTWVLTIAGQPEWTQLSPAGGTPPSFVNWTAVYDSARDRAVLCGGQPLQCWALYLTDPTWVQLAPSGLPPTGRTGHTAIYDPIEDCMIIFGGLWAVGSSPADMWELRWEHALGVDEEAVAPVPLLRAIPNPTRDGVTFSVALPAGAGAFVLRVYDASGARIRSLRGVAPASGACEVGWDGRDERGRLVPAGVYLGSLEARGRRVTRKVVVVR